MLAMAVAMSLGSEAAAQGSTDKPGGGTSRPAESSGEAHKGGAHSAAVRMSTIIFDLMVDSLGHTAGLDGMSRVTPLRPNQSPSNLIFAVGPGTGLSYHTVRVSATVWLGFVGETPPPANPLR